MAREPILIGLDDSPIVIQAKGVDWIFNPDPQPEFLVKLMRIATSLQNEELDEIPNMAPLLTSQLVEPDQKKLWEKTEPGFKTTASVLFAYLGEITNFPTVPLSESGELSEESGPKS